jgi:dihydrofolate reductase
MAEMLNRSKKLVFSRTRPDVTWNNSHIVRELDPRQIEEMKRQSGKDMIIFGSGTIVSQLTERRLIDEYQLIVGPVILGSGRPLFTGVSKHMKLELLEARPYASGNLVLRYAPSSTP